jgi:hypothetical protein
MVYAAFEKLFVTAAEAEEPNTEDGGVRVAETGTWSQSWKVPFCEDVSPVALEGSGDSR